MNKTQLVEAVTARIGDRRTAAAAVDGVLDTIVGTVGAGESVTISGFGVFEARARAARTARNPRTGAEVTVPAVTVPAFRPGAGFRAAVRAGAAAPSTELPGVPFEPEAPAGRNGAAPNGAARKAPRSARKAPLVTAASAPPPDGAGSDGPGSDGPGSDGPGSDGTGSNGAAPRKATARRVAAFAVEAPAVAPGKGKAAKSKKKVGKAGKRKKAAK